MKINQKMKILTKMKIKIKNTVCKIKAADSVAGVGYSAPREPM